MLPSTRLVPVIGLEVHAQLAVEEKLFSGAPTKVYGKDANTCASMVDIAFPGMLPVVNPHCVQKAIRMGLGVGGKVQQRSVFERKHYFYPDNPAGYQISQYLHPIVLGGEIPIPAHGGEKRIPLERIHLEQDAGQSLHDQDPRYSYINFNRAGIGLMEIVTLPAMESAEEAVAYVKELRRLMRFLGVCDGDMEKGQLRVDANISVHVPGTPLGTRSEIKNMNSLSFLKQALLYEIGRHMDCVTRGIPLVQDTRGFNPSTGQTYTMRTKEDAQDYRYFPDPDLPPLLLSLRSIEDQAKSVEALIPWKIQKTLESLGLSAYDAGVLTQEPWVSNFFRELLCALQELCAPSVPPVLTFRDLVDLPASLVKQACNFTTGELFSLMKERDVSQDLTLPFTPKEMATLIWELYQTNLSHSMAKEVFTLMWKDGGGPEPHIQSLGFSEKISLETIEEWVAAVIEENPLQVEQYLGGKEKLFTFFQGQVMRLSRGKATPQTLKEVLQRRLDALKAISSS